MLTISTLCGSGGSGIILNTIKKKILLEEDEFSEIDGIILESVGTFSILNFYDKNGFRSIKEEVQKNKLHFKKLPRSKLLEKK